MDQFMERAVELSRVNVKEGGQPFGAVLVHDGKVVAEGVNEIHKVYDVSGHAELLAIREAQNNLQTHDLTGFTMYASGEPCPMCLTAMYYASIKDIYYCASIEDAEKAGLGASVDLYADLKKPREERAHFNMVHMPLQDKMQDPLQEWKKRV